MAKGSDALGVGWTERRRGLGAAIRRARHPMTQTEVGAALNRPQSCVSVWEKGGVELGVDRVFELEELFGLRHGVLLEAGGYLDPVDTSWWLTPQAESGMADRVPLDQVRAFPVRLASWLPEHGVLVEAAAVLRELPRETQALGFLLDIGRLAELRLGWELWVGACEEAGVDPEAVMLEFLSPVAMQRCRMALYGTGMDSTGHLRAVAD